MCTLADFDHLRIVEPWKANLCRELEWWHKSYLPKQVKEGDYLDLGARCGETVQLFLNHGAKRVLAVECDSRALKCLRENFGKDPRVLIIESRIGHVKCDIEGGEWGMVLEAHDAYPRLKPFVFHGGTTHIYSLERSKVPYPSVSLKNMVIWLGSVRHQVRNKLWSHKEGKQMD